MTLNELRVGDVAVVTDIDTKPDTKRRLMDIGLARGTKLEVRRFAPLGDPIEIALKDFSLALRAADAKMITVNKISDAGRATYGGEQTNAASENRRSAREANRSERGGLSRFLARIRRVK